MTSNLKYLTKWGEIDKTIIDITDMQLILNE